MVGLCLCLSVSVIVIFYVGYYIVAGLCGVLLFSLGLRGVGLGFAFGWCVCDLIWGF